MEFKTYKVRQGQYSGVVDSTIRIPDKLKLITGGKHDLGDFIHDGNLHYLGIVEGDEDSIWSELKGLHVYSQQCGKYVIIVIHDISFVEPYPYIVTADELNEEFDLSKYFIVTWSSDLRILNMKKIMKVNSEFNIEVLMAANRDYFNVDKMQMIDSHVEKLDNLFANHYSHSDYSPLAPIVVEGDIANDYWDTLINNVTSKFGKNIPVKTVDIDFPHELFRKYVGLTSVETLDNVIASGNLAELNDFIELDNYLNMKKKNGID
jgi:hypothetical protein